MRDYQSGSARGRNWKAPQGLETRPTSDMVKEAMFQHHSVLKWKRPWCWTCLQVPDSLALRP